MGEDKWGKLIDCHYGILRREKNMLLADINPELEIFALIKKFTVTRPNLLIY